MIQLEPIDGWVSHVDNRRGPYVDEHRDGLGGTWIREYSDNYQVVILNNGNELEYYRFPKTSELPIKSKMVRWQNLYHEYDRFTGRDGIKRMDVNQDIVDAVCAGLKPIGFIETPNENKIKKYRKQVERAGLSYNISLDKSDMSGSRYITKADGLYRMGIANHGTIGGVFDLENWAESYKQMAHKAGYKGIDKNLAHVLDRAQMKLSDFIPNYDCDGPLEMLTGLILGYPIESTFSYYIW